MRGLSAQGLQEIGRADLIRHQAKEQVLGTDVAVPRRDRGLVCPLKNALCLLVETVHQVLHWPRFDREPSVYPERRGRNATACTVPCTELNSNLIQFM